MKEFAGKTFLLVEENATAPGDPRPWHEAQSLKNAGAEVIIICPKAKSQHSQEKYIVIDGIHIYRYKASYSKGTHLGYIKEYITAFIKTAILILRLLFKHYPIHVLHAANPPDIFWPFGLVLKIFRIRFIFDEHDLGPETYLSRYEVKKKDGGIIYKIQKLMQSLSYRIADVIISTNESYRERAISVNPKYASKTFVVRNGPDLRVVKPKVPDPLLKKGRSYMAAFFGTMNVQDGVENIVSAIDVLVKERKFNDLIVYIIGAGDDVPRLKQQIHELKLDDYFIFTGYIPWNSVLKILSTADVCLSPDPKNPLNDVSTMNKVMEYMAVGKPFVSFDLKEAKVTAGESALYVESNNIQAFAEGILDLIHNPQLCKKMGEIGKERIEKEFSWQKQEKNLLNVYKYILWK